MTATYEPTLNDYYTNYRFEDWKPEHWCRWLHEELFNHHILYSIESRSRSLEGMRQSLVRIIERKYGARYKIFVPYWLVVAPDQANHSVHAHMLVSQDCRMILEREFRRILVDYGHHLHVSDSTGERYTRNKIEYAVYKHLKIPGAEIAMYNPKAAPPVFWEIQRLRRERLWRWCCARNG